MDIIHQGVGPIRLGMHPADVVRHFGAECVYENWMGGNLNDSLFYHGIIFRFDKCNAYGPLPEGYLEQIDIHGREDVYLFKQPLESWTRHTLIDYLERNKITFELLEDGELIIPLFSVELSFDNNGILEYVCMCMWLR